MTPSLGNVWRAIKYKNKINPFSNRDQHWPLPHWDQGIKDQACHPQITWISIDLLCNLQIIILNQVLSPLQILCL
jgi:hypothetical protein